MDADRSSQLDARTSQPPRDLIASLQRGLQILELLASAPEGLLAKTISARTGLNLSTCYHLLNTLIDTGYVVKPDGSQRFILTGKVTYPPLARLDSNQLTVTLLPYVRSLRDRTNQGAYVSIRSGTEIVISAILDVAPVQPLSVLQVGFNAHNHATALGKAILAHLDGYDVMAHLDQYGMPGLTRNTITSPSAFKRELSDVRTRRYSLDREEFAEGVFCIAAPIFNAAGQVVASLGIALQTSQYGCRQQITHEVHAAAVAATHALTLLQFTGEQPAPVE